MPLVFNNIHATLWRSPRIEKHSAAPIHVGESRLSGDCELIEQSILNRYPLILVECEARTDFNLVRLRLQPDSPVQEVHLTMQDYLDGAWEQIVDRAVRELNAM